MNIWTIYQFASTPKIPGSERTFQFAKAFAKSGHNVTLWTSSFSHWGKYETIKGDAVYELDKEENVNIISLKTKPLYYANDIRRFLNMIYFACALYRTSAVISPRPDVIIASYPSPFAAVAALHLARKYNAKFIVEIRDLWPQNWIERKAYPRYHPFIVLLSFMEKYLYRRTDYFVTVLPYVSDYLSEIGIKPEEIVWIPNGIHLEEFKEAADSAIADKDVKMILESLINQRQNGVLNVIYVGGIGVGNRVDHIVRSAEILQKEGENNISFTIIGEGHSKEDLTRDITNKKLDSVKIFNAIPRNAVPKVLNHADVGILCLNDNPIYRYGVNLHKVYDYMAAGLPIVLAANVKNNLVDTAQAGFTVPPGDVKGIAEALIMLASMTKEERSAMGQQGYAYLSANYDINNQLCSKYLDIILSGY